MSTEDVRTMASAARLCGNADLLQKISDAFNYEHLSAYADISGYRKTSEEMGKRAELKWKEAIELTK